MAVPMVCFVCWNRAGLTARNLTALLDTTDDFELFIIDNNSQDDTWKFIESLDDDRIKCKKRFEVNRGSVYAINYVLSKRKKDQYFIEVENDVCVKTKDWITKFMKAMDTFPEVGLMSAAFWGVEQKIITPKIIKKDDSVYYQDEAAIMSCYCIRPELFEHIGYFNEETCLGDIDIFPRVGYFTPFKLGTIDTIKIDQAQVIPCEQCLIRNHCSSLEKSTTCFEIRKKNYQHLKMYELNKDYQTKYIDEIRIGNRPLYCASIHDPESIENHMYKKEVAEKNFQFYIDNGN